ncbi:tyrosine-type recombinase/integrase, partial [Salmonella enterica]
QTRLADEGRFRVVAQKWFKTQKEGKVTAEHAEQIWSSLANHVLPSVGDIPVTELKAPVLIAALKPLEEKGALETLRRIVQRVNNVMEYAVNLGLMDLNPLYRVSQVFASPEVTNMPSISPKRLDELVQRVEHANLASLTRYMIWWQLLTLVRPGEAAGARWNEIDEKENLWIIPAERMKKRRIHKVQLSPEMLWVIEKLKPITGHTPFLFPGRVKPSQPMNSETVNKALRRMGFTGELVSHGYRWR